MAWKIIRLHADGVHDDTEALQAVIDGRVVDRADGQPVMPIRAGDLIVNPPNQKDPPA